MKELALTLILLLAIGSTLSGEEAEKTASYYVKVPVNIRIMPTLGMAESAAPERKIINYISFSLLAGHSAKLKGIEFGGFWNYCSEEATGVQFGGIANLISGNVTGLQFGGIANLISGNVTGLQFGGIENLISGNVTGLQFGGIANIAKNDLSGAQFGGVANYAKNIKRGFQIAGVLNIAETMKSGFQIGVINISKTNKGVPIGLVSYVKEAGFRYDVWVDDGLYVKAGLRSGTRKFYNLFFMGAKMSEPESTAVGYGLGVHFNMGKLVYLETDTTAQFSYKWLRNFKNWERGPFVCKSRFISGLKLSKSFSIYGGLTYSQIFSKDKNDSEYSFISTRNKKIGSIWHRNSLGFVLGVRIM